MANGDIHLKLDVDEREIENAISKEIVSLLNKTLLAMSKDGTIRNPLEQMIDRQIRNTPEYDSLFDGKLAATFGLSNPAPILQAIIDTVKSSMQIDIRPATYNGSVISAGITVSILIDDFSDVLNVAGTNYDSKGGGVDWLRWLLTAGDSVVIADYDVVFGSSFVGSRTDFAIMEHSIDKGYRVPPEFSGTKTNNWLTRAFEGAEDLVGNILFVELNRRLS